MSKEYYYTKNKDGFMGSENRKVRKKKTYYYKDVKTELKKINDTLLELYNTPGMALHFQPSKLKILREQIEKLVMLEQVV
tara:strand:- start:425 stop:664 length:240 start_codon:yes stop_codon:yes gene_type:complete